MLNALYMPSTCPQVLSKSKPLAPLSCEPKAADEGEKATRCSSEYLAPATCNISHYFVTKLAGPSSQVNSKSLKVLQHTEPVYLFTFIPSELTAWHTVARMHTACRAKGLSAIRGQAIKLLPFQGCHAMSSWLCVSNITPCTWLHT